MRQIPRPALLLGLAGVLPFAAFALAQVVGLSFAITPNYDAWLLLYGLTILSFMAGCIWAYAARDADPMGYGLSTLPALLGAAVLMFARPIGILGDAESLLVLALTFALLLLLDQRAAARGQTPEWWMPLRVLLTSLVILCLCIGAFA